jgi:hypothetical protein
VSTMPAVTTAKNGTTNHQTALNNELSGGNLMIHNAELFVDFVESLPPHPFERDIDEIYPLDSIEQSIKNNKYNETGEEEQGKGDEKKDDELSIMKRRKKETEEYFERVKRETEKRRISRQSSEDEKFIELYNSLLEDRAYIMNDLSYMLKLEAEHAHRKKQEIYEQWLENVFNPIQEQIESQLQSTSIEEIERRRRTLFDQFLQMSNKKNLFLDIIIPQDSYNPLEHNEKHTIKYKMKSGINKSKSKQMEDSTSKLGKRLDIRMWDKMDATTYGHYERERKVSALSSQKFESKLKFDDFDRTFYVDEVKPGRKVNYEIQKNSKKSLAEFSGFAEIS